MRNYQDNKCSWGYITLCDRCAEIVKANPHRRNAHIKTEIEVKGFPLMEECEACGKKENTQ